MNNENTDFSLRKVNKLDIDFLFNLRNNPEVYKYFKDPTEVKYEEHVNWISPILNNEKKDVLLYLILYKNERSGQIRFDLLEENNVGVSISLDPKYHGKGIASYALDQRKIILKEKGINKIIATVHQDNLASFKLFEKKGFIEKEINNKEYIFEYKLK